MRVFDDIKNGLEQAIAYEKGDATMVRSTNLIRISESDNWIVDYDKERGQYRVSYFEDYHFCDEFWFDAYKDKEVSLAQPVTFSDVSHHATDCTFEQIKNAIDDFNRMCAESMKSDKEMYEVHNFKMLTDWDAK